MNPVTQNVKTDPYLLPHYLKPYITAHQQPKTQYFIKFYDPKFIIALNTPSFSSNNCGKNRERHPPVMT